MNISEQAYKEAKEIVKLYELQQQRILLINSIPRLEDGMILEYRDLTGNWYEYTKELQENVFFEPPLGTRVRMLTVTDL